MECAQGDRTKLSVDMANYRGYRTPKGGNLEEELEAKLQNAGRHRSRSDEAERSVRVEVIGGRIELRMVEGVVKFRPELHGGSLPNLRVLDDGNVPVKLSWAHHGADSGVSKTSSAAGPKAVPFNRASDADRSRKRRSIDPAWVRRATGNNDSQPALGTARGGKGYSGFAIPEGVAFAR